MDSQTTPDPSNDQSSKVDPLTANIQQQLHAGLQPNEVAAHLRQAGWSDDLINQAFQRVQQQVVPTATVAASGDTAAINGPKRGRIKTGWLLFKQSIKVLRGDKMLTRYIVMSLVMTILLGIVFGVILVLGRNSFFTKTVTGTTTQYNLGGAGYIPLFIYYVIAFFIINLYGAGLAANVLDLFHGQKQSYETYMKKAWSKAGTVFVFSVIEATVGLILRLIAERSKLLGRIIVAIIGAAWSLARIFVVPIIVTSDENAVAAIKESTQLLIATWGENIIGRVSLGGVVFLIYLFIVIPVLVVLTILLAAIGGAVGVVIAVVLIVISLLVFSIVVSTASGVLNTALFYYAKTKQVPAAFDPELFHSVFVHKRQRKNKNSIQN